MQKLKDDIEYKKMKYRKANLEDAKISGYTDENGNAIEMAKPDVKGHPTGALTDVGAGRSSVAKAPNTPQKKTVEDEAPTLGEEQAP